MQALGANCPFANGARDCQTMSSAQDLAKEIPSSYVPLQFENPDNPAAYYS